MNARRISQIRLAFAVVALVGVWLGAPGKAAAINCCYCPPCSVFPADCSTNNWRISRGYRAS